MEFWILIGFWEKHHGMFQSFICLSPIGQDVKTQDPTIAKCEQKRKRGVFRKSLKKFYIKFKMVIFFLFSTILCKILLSKSIFSQ